MWGKCGKQVGKRGKRATNVEKVGRNWGNWVKMRKMWEKVASVGSLLRLDFVPPDIFNPLQSNPPRKYR